ncbi:glycosyltransferase family 2 protein [Candidatus Viridilinea mediisalina]|uniref:Glycosyltransferase 2-like domain-containing protein n=1 Tax=Candidatus Viridilinea mediisalina TaxID=2024553 RepID=A0A2A6RLT7_9CHLR|nr:glycosyltransferase family 2 protein [Candidatus Viridilinea mediisalina]PDW04064.1 hypothetical protein CJ255_05695 [Candidatus Viridilinea mediisalina]
MKCAVLVLAWNGGDALQACLERVLALEPAADQVMVVDNASHDGSADRVAHHFPTVTLVRNEANLGFSGGMNVGLRALMAQSDPPDAILLLNQDTLVDVGWLGALGNALHKNPALGAVGCKIRYPDGTIQHAGVYLEEPRAIVQHVGWHQADDGRFDQPAEMPFVTGAALALRRSVLEHVGLFDAGYAPAYFEDTDLLWRIGRAGYRVGYEPRATLVHHESLSLPDPLARSALYNRGRLRFVLKSYPLEVLTGPFAEAEQRFIQQHARYAEGRVLRWAYNETLANLAELVATRRTLEPDLHATALPLIHKLLCDMRQALAHALYHQAQDTVTTMRAL